MRTTLALLLLTVGCGSAEVPACGSDCDHAARNAMVTAACCDGKCCALSAGCDSGERYVLDDGTLGSCVAGEPDLAVTPPPPHDLSIARDLVATPPTD
jgi:hypothetical protein